MALDLGGRTATHDLGDLEDIADRCYVLDAGQLAQNETVLPTLPGRASIGGAILILPPEPSDQLVSLRDSGHEFRQPRFNF